MKEEIVRAEIERIAFGNKNFIQVMEHVYDLGKEIVDTWPDENVAKLRLKLVQSTGCLIHCRMNLRELNENFWQSGKGKRIDLTLSNYIEKREKLIFKQNGN